MSENNGNGESKILVVPHMPQPAGNVVDFIKQASMVQLRKQLAKMTKLATLNVPCCAVHIPVEDRSDPPETPCSRKAVARFTWQDEEFTVCAECLDAIGNNAWDGMPRIILTMRRQCNRLVLGPTPVNQSSESDGGDDAFAPGKVKPD